MKFTVLNQAEMQLKLSIQLIEGYGLDMKQVNSSEGGMIAQAIRQMEQEKPVVFYGWRPHTMFNKMDIKVIEDTKGFFSIPDIHVITNAGLKEECPGSI